MKILVQWTSTEPRDWDVVEAADWAKLPGLDPRIDGQWLFSLNVQGVVFGEGDHTAVEELPDGTIRVTNWADDLVDWPIGQRWAIVHTFAPLQPDPALRGAINTKQRRVIYGEPQALERLRTTAPTDSFKDWSEFVPPSAAITRHGAWVSDALMEEHLSVRRRVGYKHAPFTDHLSRAEVDARGALLQQRTQGRFLPNTHTITYICRDTDRAVGWIASVHEDALELTTATAATETREVPLNTVEETWCFTTPIDAPNSADWPNGDYRVQYDVPVLDSGVTLSSTHFNRISSDTNTLLAEIGIDSTQVTTTGLSLRSITVDPAAGSASDRLSISARCTNSNTMGGSKTITLELNTSDSFADGPWTAGPSQISGSAALVFSNSGVLTGDGALGGSAAQVFANAGVLTADGVLAGATNVVFTNTATLVAANAQIDGVAALVFANSATLAGDGALAGAANVLFANSGTLVSQPSQIAGSADLVFVPVAALAGAGALAGSALLAFIASGDLTVQGGAVTGNGGWYIVLRRRRRSRH